MTMECPFILDVDGTDIQAEGARLRGQGAATLVELPGGVSAWAIGSAELLRSLLTDPRVPGQAGASAEGPKARAARSPRGSGRGVRA